WDSKIYLAPSATLMDELRGEATEAEHILMVCHNPVLEELVFDFVSFVNLSGPRSAVEVKYPTASLAELTLDIEQWADIKDDCATFDRFTRPRDLDQELGPDYI